MNQDTFKIISVVGARPNFMKAAPIHKAIEKYNQTVPDNAKIENLICHTGQHYDENMSKIFFDDLELPRPDFYLNVGSGSHAEQTARIMIEFEKVLINEKPDLIIVVGDVNSTIACSLTAAKLGIKTAHIEAGLRSFDRTMPEEINRLLTDQIADYLFVTEQSGVDNLLREGVGKDNIFFVGNVMIDSLSHYLPKISESKIFEELGLPFDNFNYRTEPNSGASFDFRQSSFYNSYVLVTLHRPSNVDDPENLRQILTTLNKLAEFRKVIFPVHPRTMKNIKELSGTASDNTESTFNQSFNNSVNHSTIQPFNRSIIQSFIHSFMHSFNPNLILIDPLGYIDFLALIKNAELIITDSGGIQEETTWLGVQCITVRNNTERPVTVNVGTNQLIGTDLKKVEAAAIAVLNGKKKSGRIPDLWDGHAAERIVDILAKQMTIDESSIIG